MSRSTPRIGLSLLPLGNLGGTGVYTEQLLRVLETKADPGVEIVPLVPKGFLGSLSGFPDIRIASIAGLRWPFQLGASWLTSELFRGLDAVHYPSGVGAPVVSPPAIATIHDVSPFLCPETMPYRRAIYLRWMFTNLAQTARTILADTEWQAERIREVFPLSRDQVRVVAPAIDPIYFEAPDRAKLPEVAREKTYLLCVGTLEPRKNLIPLLGAYRRSDFDADLFLVGHWGWKTRSIRQTLVELGTHDDSVPDGESWRLPDGRAVYRLDTVENASLAALYRNAFALLSASLFEGFGLPIAEAMASGCPVATRPDSAMAEVAGKAAWFFEPQDPDSLGSILRTLATQDREGQIRIECGKARAKLFGDDPFVEALMKAYRESV